MLCNKRYNLSLLYCIHVHNYFLENKYVSYNLHFTCSGAYLTMHVYLLKILWLSINYLIIAKRIKIYLSTVIVFFSYTALCFLLRVKKYYSV